MHKPHCEDEAKLPRFIYNAILRAEMPLTAIDRVTSLQCNMHRKDPLSTMYC